MAPQWRARIKPRLNHLFASARVASRTRLWQNFPAHNNSTRGFCVMVAARGALLLSAVWLASFSAATAFAQDRHDRRMDVINETDRVVQSFYATNSSTNNWGRDVLGQDVIPPKQSYRFDFNDGTGQCMFDLRAVLDNGRFFERYRVNVCTASSWRLFGAGTAPERAPTAKSPRQAPPASKAQPGPGKSAPPSSKNETDI
jgi:hypothetical protein